MKLLLSLLLPFICFIFPTTGISQNPSFEWAKLMGGTGLTVGRSITTDVDGNILSIGDFANTVDFDPGTGVIDLTSSGKEDVYIQKLDANGNFIWAKKMGGTGSDIGYSITTDIHGNIYTVGSFEDSVDFDPGIGTLYFHSLGRSDIFVQKLDSNGNLLWVKQIGGKQRDIAYSIASDIDGGVCFTGFFEDSVDFDPGIGISNFISKGGYDIFIQKLDSNGNFVWGKQVGGKYSDYGFSIAIDNQKYIYTTGLFRDSVDFNPGVGTTLLVSSGEDDVFIQKLDSNGNFLWVKQMGGVESDIGRSISTDVNGNVYTVGEFRDTVDFDPGIGTFKLVSAGSDDVFIQKLDANGSFAWAKRTGGTDWDVGLSIALDVNGNIYATGHFRGTVDFDPGIGTLNLISAGNDDIFIQKLDGNGNLVWTKKMGGSGQDVGHSISIDNNNSVYTTGIFIGTVDFDPNAGVFNLTTVGSTDIFIQKLSQTLTVGLQESIVSDEYVVYPNPTEGPISIRLNNYQEQLTVRLFSISGQELMSKNFQNSNAIELEINQPKGIYLLELTDEQGNKEVLKVLKK